MNGISKITESIEAEIIAEIQAIRDETELRCKEIKERYDKEARAEYDALMSQGVKDCESRVQRMGSTAEMESRKAILAMKQDMVSRAFETAIEKVCSLPEDEYVAFLARQAAKAASTGEEELVLNKKDRAAVGKKIAKAANELLTKRGLPGNLTVSEDTRDIKGGLLVKQGDIEANCTVEAIASSFRSEMASQVAGAMF